MPASRDIWQIYHLPLPPSWRLVLAVVLPFSCNETESKKSSRYGLIGRWYDRARPGKQTQQNTTKHDSQTVRQSDSQTVRPINNVAPASLLAWQGEGWIIHLSPGPGTDYHLVQFWSHCIHTSPFRLRSLIHYSIHCIPLFLNWKNHISHRQGF